MTGAVPSPALHVCCSRSILLINSHACMQHRAPHNQHAHMHAEAWPRAPLNPIESDLKTRVTLKQPFYCRLGGAKAGEATLAAREAEVHRAAAALQDRARQLATRQQQLDARWEEFLIPTHFSSFPHARRVFELESVFEELDVNGCHGAGHHTGILFWTSLQPSSFTGGGW